MAWLREAAAFFAARGEQPVAAACRALLRRAGAPVPRAGRGDPVVPASLRALGVTSREADVLALVAEGLTNQELAARLHLSPRTVEKHVASLLAKTGCRRRAQLAGYSATVDWVVRAAAERVVLPKRAGPAGGDDQADRTATSPPTPQDLR